MIEKIIMRATLAAATSLVFATGVHAQNDPIVQIDANWNGSPTYQPAGFTAWGGFNPPALAIPGASHTQTLGPVDFTLTPTLGPDNAPEFTTTLDGRQRFMDFGASNDLFRKDVYDDFVFFARNTAVGLGHNYFTYDLAGLAADSVIRVRMYNYEPNASPTDDRAFMAYSLADPGLTGNYQPAEAGVVGDYENLTPMLQRSRYTGPWPADPVVNDPLAYTVQFTVPTDALGNATFYGWADALSYSVDTAGRFNGMEIFTQLRGDMNFDDVVDANDAPLFNDIIAGNRPQLAGLDNPVIPGFAAGVDQGAHAFDAAADMDGNGVLDAADTALFNALIGGGLVGDLDGDGFVGISDLNLVLGNWNQNVTAGDPLSGDPSGDGFVGIEDLNEVLGNWNAGTPPTAGTAVPEPATLALLGLGGLAMMRRR